MHTLGFIGGTGPQGRGLALRLAASGQPVLLGSRDATRAAEAVGKIHSRAQGAALDVTGVTNQEAAAGCDVAFVVVPYAGQDATLRGLVAELAGKVVVACVNPLAFDEHGPYPVAAPGGSAAQECAALLPDARVVGAFQNVSATRLLGHPEPIPDDVLICGDDDEAKEAVAALAAAIPGLRPVDAGPLRLAGPVEDLTAVILSVNKRYGAHAGVAVTGLGEHERWSR